MSDDTTKPPSSGEQTVPLTRLNEVIAQRNAAAAERAALQQTVQSMTQMLQQQRAPQRVIEEPAEIRELKETNPNLYKLWAAQQSELRQVRAGVTSLADQTDREAFLRATGKKGEAKLREVEEILENERRNGNFKATRHAIYVWQLGQERLQKDLEGAGEGTAETPKFQAQPNAEVPGSDPRHVSSAAAGTASSVGGGKTREELERELENIEF